VDEVKFSVWIVMMAISFGFAFVAKVTWELTHSIGFTAIPLLVSFFCFVEAISYEQEEDCSSAPYDPYDQPRG
jgi:hypothetical protein